MEMKKEYMGRYFSILGDSISTLAGYHPPECAVFYDWENKYLSGVFAPEDTWWGRVMEALGGRLLMNHSWAGSLVCKHPHCEIESYGCSDPRTGGLGVGTQMPDVVMILMGLNDFGWGMRLEPTAAVEDLSIFRVAYETMLKKVKRNYPSAEIWCLTLPVGFRSNDPDYTQPAVRSGGHMADYCRIIRECAQKFDCKIVDIHKPDRPYDTIDGYHPTADGMKTIAEAVLEALGKVAIE